MQALTALDTQRKNLNSGHRAGNASLLTFASAVAFKRPVQAPGVGARGQLMSCIKIMCPSSKFRSWKTWQTNWLAALTTITSSTITSSRRRARCTACGRCAASAPLRLRAHVRHSSARKSARCRYRGSDGGSSSAYVTLIPGPCAPAGWRRWTSDTHSLRGRALRSRKTLIVVLGAEM